MQKGKTVISNFSNNPASFMRGMHTSCPHWFKPRCWATKTQITLAHVPKSTINLNAYKKQNKITKMSERAKNKSKSIAINDEYLASVSMYNSEL